MSVGAADSHIEAAEGSHARVIQSANMVQREGSHGEYTETVPANSCRIEGHRMGGCTLLYLCRAQSCGIECCHDSQIARGLGRRCNRVARVSSFRDCQSADTAAASVSDAAGHCLCHCCLQAAAIALNVVDCRVLPADFFPCNCSPDPDRYDGSSAAAEISILYAGDCSDGCNVLPLPALVASLKKLASSLVRSPCSASSRQNSVVPPVWIS